MPNQRKAGKRSIGGYMDEEFKDLIKRVGKIGRDESAFLEWAIIRGLLVRDCLTVERLRQMAKEGRLRESTVVALVKDGVL